MGKEEIEKTILELEILKAKLPLLKWFPELLKKDYEDKMLDIRS